ncbi:MAG: hypothetical protein ABI665_03110 [Vicinamibacterales bacterium]
MARRVLVILFTVVANASLFAQLNQRAPLTPAETLLEPALLRAIDEAAPDATPVTVIQGTDASAGDIVLYCERGTPCDAGQLAARKLQSLIAARRLAPPARSIRMATAPTASTRAAIHLAKSGAHAMQVVRSPWSTAAIGDEIVGIFAGQAPYGAIPGSVTARSFDDVGQPRWDGIPVTAIVAAGGVEGDRQAGFVAAASAYFLATLPNDGSEALLSHLMVGAHARLAEDGRRAVAMMGKQQRASGEVLTMFAQAIEREQRRILSFERFVPGPIDPLLHERLTDMTKSITGVWASMALTPAPFVPAAERIRGRGGEDRRVPTRIGQGPLPTPEPPTAFLKFTNVADIIFELGNLTDGKRSISDIRDVLSAEFGSIALPVIADYFERLAATGAVAIK